MENDTDVEYDYICLNVKCVKDLIDHIKEKKRRLDLYRKILELKYNRYKKCHNYWSWNGRFRNCLETFRAWLQSKYS